jgi:hypothetical protein
VRVPVGLSQYQHPCCMHVKVALVPFVFVFAFVTIRVDGVVL